MKPDQPLTSLAAGFAKLMASQLAAKVVTFAMNLWVARSLSPEAYGLGAVQFHLVTTTILQISREGFRRGCVRASDDDSKAGGVTLATRVLSVSWLCIPWGVLVAAAVCGGVIWRTPGSSMLTFHQAVLLHGMAAVLELLSEPLFILANAQLAFGVRAAVDSAANIAKCGVTLVLVLHTRLDPALVFSVAALVFSGLTSLGYFLYGLQLRRQGHLQLQAHRWDAEDRQTLVLTGLFMLQSVEKLLLAEGSKLVMVLVDNSYNQGVFGLVNNLGSLVVRLIFAPFEDAAFTAFSRAGVAAKKKPSEQQQLGQVLAVLVRGVTLLGLLATCCGPWYSYVLLRLVYGRLWAETEAPLVLSCYTGYILLLAVNGITEAFTHAVLGAAALKRSNALLLVFTGVHLGCSLALVRRLGACGLIAADALNMLLRVAYSSWCIQQYFRKVPGFSVRMLLPSSKCLAGFVACTAALAASYRYVLLGSQQPFMAPASMHIGVGVGVVVLLAGWVYRTEATTLRLLLSLQRSKGSGAAKDE